MSVPSRRVLLCYLGLKIDVESSPWRPTVELCRSKTVAADELVLLYPGDHPKAEKLAQSVLRSAREAALSRGVTLETHPIGLKVRDPWSLPEVTRLLLEHLGRLELLRSTRKQLFVSVSTGTVPIQTALSLLVREGHLPAQLVLYVAPDDKSRPEPVEGFGDVHILPSRLEEVGIPDFSRPEAGGTGWDFRSAVPALASQEARIESVAGACRDPILLLGQTGTGKTVMALRIFTLKRLASLVSGKFVAVNCATLHGGLVHSTLFGHVKGAATGVTTARKGELLRAHRGLLFLDEIGELPLDAQAMLLKALDEKTFLPEGGESPVRSDFQLVAATNRPLRELVERGAFRRDLYARLNQWEFELPGLERRRADIPRLVELELQHASVAVEFAAEAKADYLDFATAATTRWPGNFRDLAASVRRMVTLAAIEQQASNESARPARVTSDIVREELERLATVPPVGAEFSGEGPASILRRHLGDRARDLSRYRAASLVEVLMVCEKSRSQAQAGRTLFGDVANPSDMVAKALQRYGLTWTSLKQVAVRLGG